MIDSTIIEVIDLKLDVIERLIQSNNRLQVEADRYRDALHDIRNALPQTSHMPAVRAIKRVLADTIGQCEPDQAEDI